MSGVKESAYEAVTNEYLLWQGWSKRMREADSESALLKADSRPKKNSRNGNAKAGARSAPLRAGVVSAPLRASRGLAKRCLPIPSREPQTTDSWSNLAKANASSVIEGRTSKRCLRISSRPMKSGLDEWAWNGRGKSTSEAMITEPLQRFDEMDVSERA